MGTFISWGQPTRLVWGPLVVQAFTCPPSHHNNIPGNKLRNRREELRKISSASGSGTVSKEAPRLYRRFSWSGQRKFQGVFSLKRVFVSGKPCYLASDDES